MLIPKALWLLCGPILDFLAVMVMGLLKLPWEKVPRGALTLISGQDEGDQR